MRRRRLNESFWNRYAYDLMLLPLATCLVLGVCAIMVSLNHL